MATSRGGSSPLGRTRLFCRETALRLSQRNPTFNAQKNSDFCSRYVFRGGCGQQAQYLNWSPLFLTYPARVTPGSILNVNPRKKVDVALSPRRNLHDDLARTSQAGDGFLLLSLSDRYKFGSQEWWECQASQGSAQTQTPPANKFGERPDFRFRSAC